MFLFYFVDEKQKTTILLQSMQCLIRTMDALSSQIDKQPPLLSTRLLLVVDYLLRHYDQPSSALLNLAHTNLLDLSSQTRFQSPSFLLQIEKLYSDRQNSKSGRKLNPCFYSLADSEAEISKNALNVISSDYTKLYACLVELSGMGASVNEPLLAEQFSIEEQLSVFYLEALVRPLLCSLPACTTYLVHTKRLLFTDQVLNEKLPSSLNHHIMHLLHTKPELLHSNDLNSAVSFFTQLWCQKLKTGELSNDIELLNYHLGQLKTLNLSSLPEELLYKLIECISQLILSQKTEFKKKFLLHKQMKTSSEKQTETILLVLNISRANSTAQVNEETTKNCLIDLAALKDNFFRELSKHLEGASEQTINVRCVNCAAYFAFVLSDLLQFLVNLSVEKEALFLRVEPVLLNINGDLASCKFLSSSVEKFFLSPVANALYPPTDKNKYSCQLLSRVSSFTYDIILQLCTQNYSAEGFESLFEELLNFMEMSVESPHGLSAFSKSFSSNRLLSLLTSSQPSASYATQTLHLVNKLFKLDFNQVNSQCTNPLLAQLTQIADLDAGFVQMWMSKLVNAEPNADALLQMALFMARENPVIGEVAALSLLSALIQIASKSINERDGLGFSQILTLMNTLAHSGSGLGHLYLFQASCIWIEYLAGCSSEKLADGGSLADSTFGVLNYLNEIMCILKGNSIIEEKLSVEITRLINGLKEKEGLNNEREGKTKRKKKDSRRDSTKDAEEETESLGEEDEDNEEEEENEDGSNEVSEEEDETGSPDEQEENGEEEVLEDEEEGETTDVEQQQQQPVGYEDEDYEPTSALNMANVDDLFEEGEFEDEDEEERRQHLQQHRPGDFEEDEDEDEDEDEEEEYGDGFNTYENPDRRSLKDLMIAPKSSSTSTSASGQRESIYQDLMSTISAAAAAISGRIQSLSSTIPETKTVSKPTKSRQRQILTEDGVDIDSKLCTYTVTKKEFMNQHWYYCHTCKMVDRIGVCIVCAKVCHRGHDVTYAKCGSFFCDCGAKEDGSCQALVKRNNIGEESSSNEIKKAAKSNRSKPKKVKKQSLMGTKCEAQGSSLNSVQIVRQILTEMSANKGRQLERQRTHILDCAIRKELARSIRRLLDSALLPIAKKVFFNVFLLFLLL